MGDIVNSVMIEKELIGLLTDRLTDQFHTIMVDVDCDITELRYKIRVEVIERGSNDHYFFRNITPILKSKARVIEETAIYIAGNIRAQACRTIKPYKDPSYEYICTTSKAKERFDESLYPPWED